MNRFVLAAALVAATALAAPADTTLVPAPPPTPVAPADAPTDGANITAADPAALAESMKGAGYRADLTADGRGNPLIEFGSSGTKSLVYFFGCTEGKACTTVQMRVGFDLPDGTTFEVMNAWNRDKRFAKAYVDAENDPYLEMDINLDFGGISPGTFRDNLEVWDRLVNDFKTHIGW